MSWNYRVVRHVNRHGYDDDWWDVHEVHYDNDLPTSLITNSVGIIGESLAGLIHWHKCFASAFDKPVLVFDESTGAFEEPKEGATDG